MATASIPDEVETFADLWRRLGEVPLERILLQPPPGSATEADVLAWAERPHKRLCELVDGTLLEKAMGFQESLLAATLIELIGAFVRERHLGIVTGADGSVRLFPGLVRIPDVAFVSWERLPDRRIPAEAIPSLAPELAVEVLSLLNTRAEMARKRRDYFTAGVRLVWEVDPRARTVAAYTGPEESTLHPATATLDGGAVLPGFVLPLAVLFADLDQHG